MVPRYDQLPNPGSATVAENGTVARSPTTVGMIAGVASMSPGCNDERKESRTGSRVALVALPATRFRIALRSSCAHARNHDFAVATASAGRSRGGPLDRDPNTATTAITTMRR